MSEIKVQCSQSINRTLMVADENGEEHAVASIHGSVQPGKSISFGMNFLSADFGEKVADEIKTWTDGFILELRKLAADGGLPV